MNSSHHIGMTFQQQPRSVPCFFVYKTKVFIFQNNHKNLDLSYKTDLDFFNCFGWDKTSSYNRISYD